MTHLPRPKSFAHITPVEKFWAAVYLKGKTPSLSAAVAVDVVNAISKAFQEENEHEPLNKMRQKNVFMLEALSAIQCQHPEPAEGCDGCVAREALLKCAELR